MTGRTAKILCGTCGRKIGAVTETAAGAAYAITAGHGGTASSPAGMFCPDHGWPDLSDPGLAARLEDAGARTPVFRARMLPRPPVPR